MVLVKKMKVKINCESELVCDGAMSTIAFFSPKLHVHYLLKSVPKLDLCVQLDLFRFS